MHAMRTRHVPWVICIVAVLVVQRAVAFDPEPYEEPAGASIAFLLNPEDQIYGISGGSGTWLTGTPVFGDYFITLFGNGIEDSLYSGVGMTLRIMPHWRVAPFIGAGGSYNYSFTRDDAETNAAGEPPALDDRRWSDQGTSYWAGHAEAGVRLWFNARRQLLELMVRYTTTSHETGDRDYGLIGISTGVGL